MEDPAAPPHSHTPSPLTPHTPPGIRPLSVASSIQQEPGINLKHGILPDYSFRVKSHLRTVIYDPKSQCSVLHLAKGFSRYSRSSLNNNHITEENVGLEKLLFAEEYNLYVGVCKYHLKVRQHWL